MQQGYIKLYRSMLDKGWSRHAEYVAVWVYILMRGGYVEKEYFTKGGQKVTLKPGQFITSRKQMAINTGVSESKIQRILSLFENEQQIEQQTNSNFRLISIVNWDKYQAGEQQNEQQVNSKRTASEQPLNTIKKEKKEKKEKNKTMGDFNLPEWIPAEEWNAFVEMRQSIKKPMTAYAKELAVKDLERLCKDGACPAEILKQSVFNSWQGLFAAKDKGKVQAAHMEKQGTPRMSQTEIERIREYRRANGLD